MSYKLLSFVLFVCLSCKEAECTECEPCVEFYPDTKNQADFLADLGAEHEEKFFTCVEPCNADQDCPAGRPCLTTEAGIKHCSLFCDDSLCDFGFSCSDTIFGQCSPYRTTACMEITNESCRTSEECPRLEERLQVFAKNECVDGICRIDSRAELNTLRSRLETVEVTSPIVWEVFGSQEPVFRWRASGQSFFVILVAKYTSNTISGFQRNSIWGYVSGVIAEGEESILWRRGNELLQDPYSGSAVWTERLSPPAPAGSLFALILEFDDRGLKARSPIIPFRADNQWPKVDEQCGKEVYSCLSPHAPQWCVEGFCKRICLSEKDCAPNFDCRSTRGIPVCTLRD